MPVPQMIVDASREFLTPDESGAPPGRSE